VGTWVVDPASLRTVAMVMPSSMAWEAPWTEVGRKGCAESPIRAIRACFEIHYPEVRSMYRTEADKQSETGK
jgi:hypothetical protein